MVSIHAPARGATMQKSYIVHGRPGFNPRPCTRGDPRNIDTLPFEAKFQSTPLHEGRPPAVRTLVDPAEVSIHAPARGATHNPY